MEATATYRRDALTAQELAFTYGQRYNLNVEQVRQLTQAPDPEDVQEYPRGFREHGAHGQGAGIDC